MDLLSGTKKNFIFMLIESPSIHWFLLAFYYFRATEGEALSPYSSFSTQSMFIKVADCVQLLFYPPSETPDPVVKSFLSFIQLTLKVRLRFLA